MLLKYINLKLEIESKPNKYKESIIAFMKRKNYEWT